MTSNTCKQDESCEAADQRRVPTPANRLCLDYAAAADRLGAPVTPIVDIHTHINGSHAPRIYNRVRTLFGVERIYSMTRLTDVATVREIMGDAIRFIAVPDFMSKNRRHAFQEGYLEAIQAYHDLGSRIVKFWAAPRSVDYGVEVGEPGLLALDNPWRIRAMDLAQSLGMMFMTHVSDPDTWFATKYTDTSRYGVKADQYVPLERLLDTYTAPWIAAHMGGWPEDLDFLDGLLDRHPNLHLDTSATKWMIREISKHPRSRFIEFLERWRGRVLFGSDIVVIDGHLSGDPGDRPVGKLAANEREAFDLYTSRYFALRTMFETDYTGESPIADPDLAMVDPDRFDTMSAPALQGFDLPEDLLHSLYAGAAAQVVGAWELQSS